MKRVLSIATLYPNAHRPRFGTFVARQMEALAARGDWDVTVVNPVGVPPVAMGRYAPLLKAAVSGAENGVKVHRPRFTLIPAVCAPFNPALIARAVLPLARRLHEAAPFDLVDAQFFYPDGPAAARIAAELNLPLSIKARGSDISHWGGKTYARRKMLQAADQASGLLAVSEALADDMAALGFPRGKITLHYTGLDRTRFRPLDREESRERIAREFGIELSSTGPALTSVGALIPRKGQRIVLSALTQMPGASLLLVGEGPDRAGLETMAQEFSLADRVHFLGNLDHEQLPLLLSAADVMVLPSESEGLANAWVEALACGTPIVISAAGGARELLRDPQAGRIVEREPGAIAEAVKDLLASPPSLSGVAQSVSQFSWEENARNLAQYYERLTSGSD